MTGSLTVLSLGPGSPDFLSLGAVNIMRSSKNLILRTEVHPVSAWLRERNISYTSLDRLYDHCRDFDELNSEIVRAVIDNAARIDTVYAVPDIFTDSTVKIISDTAACKGITYTAFPGVSYAAGVLGSGKTGMTDGIYIVSAASLLSGNNNSVSFPMIILEIDSRYTASVVKLVLNRFLNDQAAILFFSPSCDYPRPFSAIALCELDRMADYDHTSAVFIPSQPENEIPQLSGRQILDLVSGRSDSGGSVDHTEPVHTRLSRLMTVSANKIRDHAINNDHCGMTDELANMLKLLFENISAGEISGNITLNDVTEALLQRLS